MRALSIAVLGAGTPGLAAAVQRIRQDLVERHRAPLSPCRRQRRFLELSAHARDVVRAQLHHVLFAPDKARQRCSAFATARWEAGGHAATCSPPSPRLASPFSPLAACSRPLAYLRSPALPHNSAGTMPRTARITPVPRRITAWSCAAASPRSTPPSPQRRTLPAQAAKAAKAQDDADRAAREAQRAIDEAAKAQQA